MALLETLFLVFIILFLSALPLHLAVVLLGGKAGIFKTMFVMFISAILMAVITAFFPFGGIIAFVVLIWVYREMFRLRWIKAILAWILQLIFVMLFFVILTLFGLSVTTFAWFF